ncbi:putative mitogen-activated protein kinase organizer 1 protein [Phaeoacremonium minimum UCRPA7]|uniref:Putative mitogen-activated protein kinase organizer 1 protein n=1 Tax=Phaeoacremonium minimum (strain UCR-PA7) TaxID=1286976 RepID=R8BQ72_PHAM7|nr:putative mitogen-activated protein kinase organizer 1 protein [Phaeoacremonium minimum UCRPA7]EOO01484.1 putative mitogen-activated protein kinase organizer 1 protein [Phaeoacremonium minimum UCRPA7]
MALPNKPAAHLLGSNGPIHAVTYSASPGTYILTGSADRSIRLYNPSPSTAVHPANSYISKQQAKQAPAVPEGRLIQTYAAHGYEVLSLAVASDNARFASSGGDRAVFLWDVTTAQTLRRFSGNGVHGHGSRINCVAFGGADDSLVISGGFDTTVRIWDTKSGGTGGGKPIQILTEARDAVSALVVRGPEIITGSVDGRVRTYDIRMGSVATDVIGPSVTSLSLTMDGNTVLVGSLDSKVRLMDRENGTCLMTYADEEWRNEELRVQSILGGKEKYVVAGDEMTTVGGASGGDGRLWAWDLLTGKLVARITVPWGPTANESRKKVIGRDGKEKERKNIVSCLAWREQGWGGQFCVGGTSGVVTVFGSV